MQNYFSGDVASVIRVNHQHDICQFLLFNQR